MVEINWTDQALEDIESIAMYISRDSKKYAALQIDRFFEKADILEFHPRIGRMVPEMNMPSVRELIEGNYRIIYRILSSKRIDILTVHNFAQKLIKRKLRSKRK
ncbi:MAG: type II toxin-antitoxin system RelE/ParE family toxin [Chitinophagaceae bacterium]|jgi:addiction module RelE/StbE family toxin|nr:MAG: type II toxin-antitoxin system RelE/ParE family toxin [Chitinophagaceae bacterium]